MHRVVTFGEIMLRLTTPGFQRFSHATHFEITFGGAEANVGVAIAQFGGEASFVTKLPQNEVAERALMELRGLGVDVTRVVRGGDRIGVYFLEQGASQRAGKVIYDRAHSALAVAKPSDFDWDHIFEGAGWFHWSGISPALSASAAQITADACAAAKRRGLTVSFDLNYRAKLWTREEAGATLRPLLKHVDVCVTSAEEVRTVFGLDVSGEEASLRALSEEFSIGTVAFTRRQASSASSTNWGAMLLKDGQVCTSPIHEITIVDRVGAGDSFTGGLIFSLLRGDVPQKAIDFAVAASCLKHTVPGDYNLVSLAEVEALAAGGHGGRVQR
ncbi:PfkB family carbohydrate kinase [Verrucomicrobiota bacterium sgz303538]